MDMNLFSQNTPSPIISTNTNDDKFQKIVTVLCEKRKKLEESTLDEDKVALLELVEEMKTFGISEIDYQKYLTIQAQHTDNA